MDPLPLIQKYYNPQSKAYHLLTEHSEAVTQKALQIAQAHPELKADTDFISEAAMLHDIGIFLTHAPDLDCHGDRPYLAHGYLGRALLENENLHEHALVCERHVGTGLSKEEIIAKNLPLPQRDMQPQSIEEQIICFADKFFSKSQDQLKTEKPLAEIRQNLAKHGQEHLDQFNQWLQKFQ